jgi:N4-gp56 family major capsid protein
VSVTTPTHVDSSIREVWAKAVLRESLVAGFWGKMTGPEGSGAPIIQKTELLNKPGDLIHIQTTTPLTGAGVSGDTTLLEGSEENLTTSEIQVSPTLYRHGVRVYRRANKKSILDLRGEAKMRLGEWGQEKMDDLRFSQFVSTNEASVPDAAYAAYTYSIGGAVGDDADDVSGSDDLTVAEVQKIKLRLQNQKAKPIKSKDGLPYYFMVVHPNCLYNLKRESEYRDWVREAAVRGEANPFFTGATAIIDGMVIFDHPNVPKAANAGAVQVATNIAFGSNAFVEGADENPNWVEKDFDYENEFGIAYSFAFQPRRALQLSSLLVYADATTVI